MVDGPVQLVMFFVQFYFLFSSLQKDVSLITPLHLHTWQNCVFIATMNSEEMNKYLPTYYTTYPNAYTHIYKCTFVMSQSISKFEDLFKGLHK